MLARLARQSVAQLYRAWSGPDPHDRPEGPLFRALSKTWRTSRSLYHRLAKPQPPVLIVLDQPPRLSGCGSFTGWVLGRDEPIVNVQAWVNQTLLAQTRPDHARPDVFLRFGQYQSHNLPGFRFCPPLGLLPDGRYPLSLRAFGASGQSSELHATLLIDNFVQADDPTLPADLTGTNRRYQLWLREYDHHSLPEISQGPVISVVMPIYRPNLQHLRDAIESVRRQTYKHWELCLCDDASDNNDLNRYLEHTTASDPRIRWTKHDNNRGISAATNSAISISRGEFVAFMDQDDILHPQALQAIACAAGNSSADVYFTDEDRLDDQGRRIDPFFKPGWSPDLLQAMMYLGHLCMYRRAFLEQTGLCDSRFDGTQDWELALRATFQPGCRVTHVPGIFYHWRLGGHSAQAANNDCCHQLGQLAVKESLARQDRHDVVMPGPRSCTFHVGAQLPSPGPLVSILIPTKDQPELLQRCLNSLRNLTSYQPLEIIVIDNGSRSAKAKRYLGRCPAERVLRYDVPFNHSWLNNQGAKEARGEFLLLLNDDTQAVRPSWLTHLVELGIRRDVGAVGAWLIYPDGRTQHNGICLSNGSMARSISSALMHDGLDRGVGLLTHEVSAVTGACLLIRKQLYLDVGGLDEVQFPTSFNDVDICLRLRKQGYRILQCPQAKLIHHESASRTIDGNEEHYQHNLQGKWAHLPKTDPFWTVPESLTL